MSFMVGGRDVGMALPQKAGRDLTPKVLANFSPGFPTLGQSASIELLTLKEFSIRSLNSFRVKRILTGLFSQGRKPWAEVSELLRS
jgi:hypothetical protein